MATETLTLEDEYDLLVGTAAALSYWARHLLDLWAESGITDVLSGEMLRTSVNLRLNAADLSRIGSMVGIGDQRTTAVVEASERRASNLESIIDFR